MIRTVVIGVLASLLLACGGTDQVTLVLEPVPGLLAECGRPADARTLLITATGDFPAVTVSVEVSQGAVALDRFPATTEQLELQILGDGGVVRAVGKTGPIALASWHSGEVLPVFVAPPEGMCETAGMASPRRGARVVEVAGGALVVGGADAEGRGVTTLEFYDANAGVFSTVADLRAVLPELGLIGASVTTLDDGRIVIAGGPRPAYYVVDPRDWSIDAEPLFEVRAHHAAIALDGGRVSMIGGCGVLDASGACDPASARAGSILIDVESGTLSEGPSLGLGRYGAVAHREASAQVVVTGGHGPSGAPLLVIERLDPRAAASGQAQVIGGAGGASGAADLAGEWISAFAPSDAPPSTTVSAVADGSDLGRVIDSAFARAGAAWVELEEGRLLAIGGAADSTGAPLYYRPIDGSIDALAGDFADLARLTDHVMVRLADGSVLVAGGRSPGEQAGARAFRLRPSLIGPRTAALTVTPRDGQSATALVPRDLAAGVFESKDGVAGYTLLGSGGGGAVPSEYALLAGPLFAARWELDASIRATMGGLAVVFSYLDARNFDLLSVLPGTAPSWLRMRDGVAQPRSCPVAMPSSAAELASARVVARAEGGSLSLRIGDRTVFECEEAEPLPAGALGLGVVGGDAATLHLGTVTVTR